MQIAWSVRVVALVSLIALVSACAPGGLTPEQKARVGAVSVPCPGERAKPTLYSDKTSQTAAMVGAQFGLVGGLVGGGIAAANINAGRKRFAFATEPQTERVTIQIREKLEEELKRTGKLPLAKDSRAGGAVILKDLSFGVAHAEDQRFHATISATIEIRDSAGKRVWSRLMSGMSGTSFTLEEAKAKSALYPAVLTEAADAFARNACEQM